MARLTLWIASKWVCPACRQTFGVAAHDGVLRTGGLQNYAMEHLMDHRIMSGVPEHHELHPFTLTYLHVPNTQDEPTIFDWRLSKAVIGEIFEITP